MLDGSLDDAVWKKAALVDDIWITYNPVNGSELPQRTRAYMAYDDQNLYFAFHCIDTQPDLIKTSLTKRDGIFEDDWVGLSLDTVGGKKYGYEFFVNPSGAQADVFRTGDMEDSSTDWVWYSAGKVVSRRLHRRDPPAAEEHPLRQRQGRAHGGHLLAAHQPPGHERLLAAAGPGPEHGRFAGRDPHRRAGAAAGAGGPALVHLHLGLGPPFADLLVRRPTRPATWASPSSTASPPRSWPRPR